MLQQQFPLPLNRKIFNEITLCIPVLIIISLISQTQSCGTGTTITLVDCAHGTTGYFPQPPCVAPCILANVRTVNQVRNGVCQGGNYMDACISCHRAVTNCATCTAGPVCLTCSPNYILVDSTNCSICSDIFPNCQFCNTNQCLTCKSGYSLATTCVLCSTKFGTSCTSCDGTNCLSCSTGHYLNDSLASNPCVLCSSSITQCATCSNVPICLTCLANHFKNVSHPNQQCVLCDTIPQCSSCINGPICTDCQSGYFLNASVVPKPLCFLCSQIPNCASCQSSQPTCLTCNSGFYHDYAIPSQQCTPCAITKCLSCDHGIVCTACDTNYIVDFENLNKSCLACPLDEYSLQNQCYKCSGQDPSCISCYYMTSSINCTLCQTEFILNPSTSLCVECEEMILNCVKCSDTKNCTLCQYPYKLGPSLKCDFCDDGFQMLDGLCIKLKGCISANLDFSKCLGCFTKYNFFFDTSASTNPCSCKKGYNIKNVDGASLCLSECGNKIVTSPDEQCDDGNLRDGDGCDRNCKLQPDFTCTFAEPSECTLQLNVTELKYNYAHLIEGKNRCKFSFSASPTHSVFALVDWSLYLSLNISANFIVLESIAYEYNAGTNEITVEMDYIETLENLIARVTLSLSQNHTQSVQKSLRAYSEASQIQKASAGPAVYFQPLIFSIPSELSVEIKIKGINSILVFEEEGIQTAAKASSIGFMVIATISLLFFLIAAYFHKMIGLETIQILQFHYFMTMIVEQKKTVFLKFLNVLMYTAFGGYSNLKFFYPDLSDETVSLASAKIPDNFRFVGLSKYFALNVNLPLILPAVALFIYAFWLVLKTKVRSDYLKNRQQHDKDLYTVRRRSAQWVYDHLVFPFVNLFSMIAFFCTILQLQSILPSETRPSVVSENALDFVEKTSFIPDVIVVFLTFFMFAYEVFVSYAHYQHSKLTEEEKARTPASTIEKLEHDENNPDRENYKPGYVLVYLIFYFLVEMVLMVNVLIEEVSQFGMDLMLALSFFYLIVVWNWNPYHESVNFHNRALKLNHFAAFFFVLTCELFTRVELSPLAFIILIYASLLFLLIASFCGFARLYIEWKFRKMLEDDPKLLGDKKKELKIETDPKLLKMSKKEKLLMNNSYTLESQIKEMLKETKIPFELYPNNEKERIWYMKNEIRRQIKSRRKNQVNINYHEIDTKILIDDTISSKDPFIKGKISQDLIEGLARKDRSLKRQNVQL